MKQLIQNMKSGKTEVKDLPIPHPGKGTVLVRTAYSLVSAGTERTLVEFSEKGLIGKAASRPDLVKQVVEKARREGLLSTVESAFNRLDQPMFPGYSSAGVIVELGAGMNGFKVGERVACGGGNHAVHGEYCVVPRNLLVKLPNEVDFDEAAFTTLGSVAVHGFRLANAQLNDTVLVIGLGLLGLMEIQIAKAAGCRVLGMDISADKVCLAKEFNVDACIASQIEDYAVLFTKNRGFDHVLICAGSKSNDSVELAGRLCRDRGNVVAIGAVGLNIPRKIYYEKEISFMVSRSYGPGRYDEAYEERGQDYPIGYVRWTEGRNMESFVDLLADKRMDVKRLITHRIPIENAEHAYEIITGKTCEKFLGVLIQYPVKEPVKANTPIQLKPTVQAINRPIIGVLGAGNYANATFLPVMKSSDERCVLRAIASGSGGKARHAAEKFGFEQVAESGSAILENPDINAVVLLTPHNLHASQSFRALENGKHVYCEKPAALSISDLSILYRSLLAHSELCYTIGYNRRFAQGARRMKEFLSESREPMNIHYSFNAGYIPTTHWTQDPDRGGGRILGEACHAMDLMIYLTGALPERVNAFALPDNGKYNEDNVSFQVRFANGSIGTVDYLANGDKSYGKEHIEVFSGGRIALLNDFMKLNTWKNGSHQEIGMRQDKGHAASWNAFLDVLSGKRECHVPINEIISGTLACFAVLDSVRNQDVVTVPSVDELLTDMPS